MRIKKLEIDLSGLSEENTVSKEALSALDSEVRDLRLGIEEKDKQIHQLDADVRKLQNEVYSIWRQGQNHRLAYEAIVNSKAWKLLSHLRQVYFDVRDIKRSLKTIRCLFTWQYRLISKSGLFDTAYYVKQNHRIAESGLIPLAHYLSFGVHEGRDPNPMFNSSYYLSQNLDIAESGMNPLAHYLSIGAHEGRDPHPLFDTSYYLEQNPDVAGSDINPLRHYLEIGAWEGRLPCLLNEGNLDPQILKICQTRLDDPKALEFDEDLSLIHISEPTRRW